MIRLNGKQYGNCSDLGQGIDDALRSFLEEWYNDTPWMTGRTSGSTGKPKEIRLYKEDMRASARLTNEFLGIGPDSVLLLCLPVSYIAGKMMVVRALESGADLLTVTPSSSPLEALNRMVDLAAMVPMQVENCLEHLQGNTLVRQLLIGGAPVSAALEERLCPVRTICYATYGMTETVSHVALRRLDGGKEYTALGNVSFSTDGRGCLIIHTPHLSGRCFVTNDLVKCCSSTRFEWLGRYDHVINSGGIKFSPEILEQKLSPLITSRFYITSQPDEHLGQRIVLVIEGERWPESRQHTLGKEMSIRLEPFEIPKRIFFIPRFRETFSGKIIRDDTCLS